MYNLINEKNKSLNLKQQKDQLIVDNKTSQSSLINQNESDYETKVNSKQIKFNYMFNYFQNKQNVEQQLNKSYHSKSNFINQLLQKIAGKKENAQVQNLIRLNNIKSKVYKSQEQFQKFEYNIQDDKTRTVSTDDINLDTDLNNQSKISKEKFMIKTQTIINKNNYNSTFKLNQIKPKKDVKQIIQMQVTQNYFNQNNLVTDQQNDSQQIKVYLLQSVYKDRPSTIFFQYNAICKIQKDTQRCIKIQGDEVKKLGLKYKIPYMQYNCLLNAFNKAGFHQTQKDDWLIFWGLMDKENQKLMQKHQKNNHFPGCLQCGRKDRLWSHLSIYKRKFHNEYNFMPNTYLMESDFDKVKQVVYGSKNDDIFILKPVSQSQGKGIKLINKKSKLKKNKNYLVSEYIKDPHLINGLKYDLRIYILVTCYDPLKIYIYQEGLCRFATELYDQQKIKQKYSHLTNYSVNKRNKNFIKTTNLDDDGNGSKWSITALKKYYSQNGINSDKIFAQINDIIIKTLICIEPFQNGECRSTSCFELYGFDILIDDKFKAWLLEINIQPSLSASSFLDKKIKNSLIADVLNLIGIQPYNHEKMQKQTHDKKIYGNEQKYQITVSKSLNSIQDLNYQNCINKLDSQSWKMLFEFDEEFYRKGKYFSKRII